MIISHKHKFIFMHNPKTAGSSISIACNPYLGPRDVQTNVWDLTLRNDGKLNRRAIFILLTHFPRLIGSSVKWSIKTGSRTPLINGMGIDKTILKYYQKFFRDGGHPTAAEVSRYDEFAWRDYFKFAIVRNPWIHSISYYHFRLSEKGLGTSAVTFNEFLRRMNDTSRHDPEGLRPSNGSGWLTFTINDKIAVNYVARFEDLERELKVLSEKIGIPLDASIHANQGRPDPGKSLREHFDSEALELVEEIYQKEIHYFGYEPPFEVR